MNPLFRLIVKLHVRLYKSSGGRRGSTMRGRKLILLTTMGRKSGEPRTVPLAPFFEGDQLYVIASMGGSPTHPAWYVNLRQDPEVRVQLGADEWKARAVPLEGGAERDRLWKLITEQMPNFGEYQKKTSRVIPVVRLERQRQQ